jgi:hypothetical protein
VLAALWLVAAAQTPTEPPLVSVPDAPRAVTLTPAKRDELLSKRRELSAQIPPLTTPVAATVGSGVLVLGGAATLFGSFIASFFNKPCTGFFCSTLAFDAGRATTGYIAGLIFLAAGIATLPFTIRMVTHTRSERSLLEGEIENIDGQLGAVAP